MIISFISINIIVGLAAFYFAYGLFKNDSISRILLIGALLYFSQITMSVLVLGVITCELRASTLYLLNLAIAMLALPIVVSYRLIPIKNLLCGVKNTYAESDWTARLLLFLFSLAFVLLLLKLWYFPPHVWDVFMYHLTPAVEWYQQERIIRDLPHVQPHISQQALGMTLLNFWYFVFLGRDTLVGLPQVLFSGLVVLTAYGFLRDTTRDISLSVKFSIVIFFIPFLLMQADTAKDHIGLSAGFFAGVFFLWKLLDCGRVKYLFPASLAFGLMAGFKMGAIAQLPIAAGLFLLYWIWNGRVRKKLGNQDDFSLKKLLIPAVLALVPILLLAGYWYLPQAKPVMTPSASSASPPKAYVAQTNTKKDSFKPKVKPATKAIEPKQPPSPIKSQINLFFQNATTGTLKNNSIQIIPRIFDYRADYTTDLIGISGYGPQFAAFGIPVFLYLFVSLISGKFLRDNVLLVPAAALFVFIFYFFTYYNLNSYRLLSFMPFMLIPSAGYLVYKHGFHESLMSGWTINMLLVFCSLWSFALTILPHYETNLLRLREFVSLPLDLRTSARYTNHYRETPSLYLQIENIPSAEPMAYISSRKQLNAFGKWSETWTYPLYDPTWKRKLYSLQQEQYLDCKQDVCRSRPALKQFLQKNGVFLITTCRTNWCFTVDDEAFVELARGLYYYQGGAGIL